MRIAMLDRDKFLAVVDATPLVSIDLIIRNERQEVYLGKRLNRPAQGFWFVPGGRIRKNERVAAALQRISLAELGFPLTAAKLIGVFDHIYDDNFHGARGINTHYVVLGHEVTVPTHTVFQPDAQHGEMKWWTIDALLRSETVHANTKRYFET